jgi:hypothetical protein
VGEEVGGRLLLGSQEVSPAVALRVCSGRGPEVERRAEGELFPFTGRDEGFGGFRLPFPSFFSTHGEA